jgi:hypothetical protein
MQAESSSRSRALTLPLPAKYAESSLCPEKKAAPSTAKALAAGGGIWIGLGINPLALGRSLVPTL